MTPTDLVIALAVLAAASWILLRSLRRSGGPCPGCSSGGCRSRGRGDPGLVRIGPDRGGPPTRPHPVPGGSSSPPRLR